MVKSCCGRLPKHCMVYKFPSIEGYANRSILLRLKEKINHGQFFFLRWCDVGVGKNLTYYAKATKYNTNTITDKQGFGVNVDVLI